MADAAIAMPPLSDPFQAKSTSIRQNCDSPAELTEAKFGIYIHSGFTLC